MGLAAASFISLNKWLLLYMYRWGGSGVFFVFLLLLWVFSKLTYTAVIEKKKMLFFWWNCHLNQVTKYFLMGYTEENTTGCHPKCTTGV